MKTTSTMLLMLSLLAPLAGCLSEASPTATIGASNSTSVPSDSEELSNAAAAESPLDNAPASESTEETIKITFEDINLGMQKDVVFRPWMVSDRVKELDGHRVRIAGYMLADDQRQGIENFVLIKNEECKFGPGGQADHLVNVKFINGVTAKYVRHPVDVEGVLTLNPYQGLDGNTWSVYDMAGESIERHRR